jgi:hypothetical protein
MMRNQEGLPGCSSPYQNLTKNTGFVGMTSNVYMICPSAEPANEIGR